MSPTVQALLIVEVFRAICVFAGCLLSYFGYRLFRVGIYEKQGELKAQWGGRSLLLRQVGPGVFFVLFGVAMASVGFLRKFEADFNGPIATGKVISDQQQSVKDLVVNDGYIPIASQAQAKATAAIQTKATKAPSEHIVK